MSSIGLKVQQARRGAAALALCLLAACGGGNDTQEPFEPNRVLAFGDELSFLESDGRKYSINAFRITDSTTNPPTESTTEIDCARNRTWIQIVASGFGLVFDRCLGSATTASGQILAQPGQRVRDLAAQLAAVQGSAVNDRDLALVMMGLHDIRDLYDRYPTDSATALRGEAVALGAALGRFVNDLARSGPRVVVLTSVDLGLTPFARAADTAAGNSTRSRLLSDLSEAFNNSLSTTLIDDGRLIGLVYADTESQNLVNFASAFNLSNVRDAACLGSAVLPDCRTDTLVSGATSSNYMWADALRFGPAVHSRLGTLATSRAKNNPF